MLGEANDRGVQDLCVGLLDGFREESEVENGVDTDSERLRLRDMLVRSRR